MSRKYHDDRRRSRSPKRSYDSESRRHNFQDSYDRRPYNDRGSRFDSGQKSKEINAGVKLKEVDWKSKNLTTFKKNFYQESLIVSKRPKELIEDFYNENNITLYGNNIPRPIFEFSEISFPPQIINEMLHQGWSHPTPIQAQGWPMALSGRNVVGIAQTGSGKTGSFLLPALVHILAQPKLTRGEGPICLILVPTRELAQQVLMVASGFVKVCNLKACVCYGGAPKPPQANELRSGTELLIATPGRLLDFLEERVINLSRCTYVVLDEADRMLDMGFEPQINKILSQIRPDKQMLMWSATWPEEVQKLARTFLSEFIQVNIGALELHANHNIEQRTIILTEDDKFNKIIDLLISFNGAKTLVFTETKKRADLLHRKLQSSRFSSVVMHGDKAQRDREYVLNQFRTGYASILVATDVAARGLDINDIKFVVNFDFPRQVEDYIHRIGRTARSDKHGVSYSFFTLKNARLAKELINVLSEAKQVIPPQLMNMAGISESYLEEKRRKREEKFNARRSKRSEHYHSSAFPHQQAHMMRNFVPTNRESNSLLNPNTNISHEPNPRLANFPSELKPQFTPAVQSSTIIPQTQFNGYTNFIEKKTLHNGNSNSLYVDNQNQYLNNSDNYLSNFSGSDQYNYSFNQNPVQNNPEDMSNCLLGTTYSSNNPSRSNILPHRMNTPLLNIRPINSLDTGGLISRDVQRDCYNGPRITNPFQMTMSNQCDPNLNGFERSYTGQPIGNFQFPQMNGGYIGNINSNSQFGLDNGSNIYRNY